MKNVVVRVLITMMLGITANHGLGQTSLLTGHLYSAETYEDISHANIVLKDNQGALVTSITSGLDGRYQTDSLQPGTYRIEINCRGYKPVLISKVYLQNGRKMTVDLAMQLKKKPELDEQVDKKGNSPELLGIIGEALKTVVVGGM